MPKTDGVDIEVDKRCLDGWRKRIEVERRASHCTRSGQRLIHTVVVVKGGDEEEQPRAIGEVGEPGGECPLRVAR